MVVKPPIAPNTTPVAALGCGASARSARRASAAARTAPAISPTASRMWAADSEAATAVADHDAHRHARDHDLQVPGAPVMPIGPDREHVLGQHGRQDDRGGLQRRHIQRQQRQRHDAEAEEPALGMPSRITATTPSRQNSGSVITRSGLAGRPRAGTAVCRSKRRREQRASDLPHGRIVEAPCALAKMACRTISEAADGRLACAWPLQRRAVESTARPSAMAHNGGDRHGCPHEPLSRGLCALAARPAGLLGRGRAGRSTGSSRPKQVFDPDAGVYGRWFAGGVCNTCWNAVDRHVMQRPRRAAGDHLRFAGHRHQAHLHLRASCWPRRRCSPAMLQRLRRRARATASSSTCRWCRRR